MGNGALLGVRTFHHIQGHEYIRGLTMADTRERISFKILGIIAGAAEGRFAIAALVLMAVLALATVVWLRVYGRG